MSEKLRKRQQKKGVIEWEKGEHSFPGHRFKDSVKSALSQSQPSEHKETPTQSLNSING